MTRTLAELRSQPRKARPERSVTICLAPELVAEVQSLVEQLAAIPATDTTVDPDAPKPPRKMSQGPDPRATEIRARLAELLAEMAEHEGEMRVRAGSDGDWRNWVNKHPARDEGEPGHDRDQEVTGGYCNADALLDDLGSYAHSWNGEPLAAGDWDALFSDTIAGPDKKLMAQAVVAMYESRLDFRQWRSGLSDSLSRLNDSDSPETSGPVPDDSTAGSPSKSSAATTETATESR